MSILTRVTDNWIRQCDKERLLPYLFWTRIKDPAAFDGASKDAIRDHFRSWVSTRSPRYRACLFVDKEAMESATLVEYPSAVNPTGFYLKVGGRVVLIDGQHGEHFLNQPGIDEYDLEEMEDGDLDKDDGYEPIEGKTTFDVGWQYVDLQVTSAIYDIMCENHDTWIRPHFYQRPPAVWDGKMR
ncbi:hypothetical protein B0H66DRAFT_613970 [Apodospora peruviana]|uniref:Uncharacterized protein n=1 Tax=Apodospora peruviana TaxID=516989 RepID=A0AAE0IUE5_9PEZI|nr:hypothetical protein B0H66DRAFT_613970 [Apodospora peruviana]